MPYSLRAKPNGKFVVVKSLTGEIVRNGEHDTQEQAIAHLRALYAAVNEARKLRKDFDENKHPRADNGEFGSGEGSSSGDKDSSGDERKGGDSSFVPGKATGKTSRVVHGKKVIVEDEVNSDLDKANGMSDEELGKYSRNAESAVRTNMVHQAQVAENQRAQQAFMTGEGSTKAAVITPNDVNPSKEDILNYAKKMAFIDMLGRSLDNPINPNQLSEIDFSSAQKVSEGVNAYLNRRVAGQHSDWSRTHKALTSHSAFLTIAKRDDEQQIVEGYASSEDIDLQGGIWPPDNRDGTHPNDQQFYEGDVVSSEAIRKALPDYMEFANLREMHDETRAVGTILKAEIVRGVVKSNGRTLHDPLHIIAKVSDPVTWQKVKDGTLKGFSILGDVYDLVITKMYGKTVRLIKDLCLTEISLVDRPANPAAQVILWKGMTSMAQQAKKKTAVAKAAADPKGAIMALQELRDEAELAGDLEKATAYSNSIALAMQAEGAEVEVVAESDEEADEEHEELGKEPPEEGAEADEDESTEGEAGEEEEAPAGDGVDEALDDLGNDDGGEESDAKDKKDEEEEEEDDEAKAKKSLTSRKTGKTVVKKAAAPVASISKAEFSALTVKVDKVSKAFAGDIARLAKALEDQAVLIDSLKERPTLREMPMLGNGSDNPQAVQIMKSMLAEETDPAIRETLGHRIAELEIKASKPNFMGWTPHQ